MHIMQLADSEQNVAFLVRSHFCRERREKLCDLLESTGHQQGPGTRNIATQGKNSVFHTFTYPLKEVGIILDRETAKKLTLGTF
jgi:hypothetical protein